MAPLCSIWEEPGGRCPGRHFWALQKDVNCSSSGILKFWGHYYFTFSPNRINWLSFLQGTREEDDVVSEDLVEQDAKVSITDVTDVIFCLKMNRSFYWNKTRIGRNFCARESGHYLDPVVSCTFGCNFFSSTQSSGYGPTNIRQLKTEQW